MYVLGKTTQLFYTATLFNVNKSQIKLFPHVSGHFFHFFHKSRSMKFSSNILPIEHYSHNLLYKSFSLLFLPLCFFITSLHLGLGQYSSFRTPAVLPWTLCNTGVFCSFLRVPSHLQCSPVLILSLMCLLYVYWTWVCVAYKFFCLCPFCLINCVFIMHIKVNTCYSINHNPESRLRI